MKNNNSAWLVRPYPNETYRFREFKTDNIVAIGWPNIGDLSYKPLKDEIDDILSKEPYNLHGISRGLASSTISLFINSMDIDDYVLVPVKNRIYIGKITSNYIYVPTKEIDGYPHQRNVTWMASTNRTDLSDDLRRLLKDRRTAANLSASLEEIKSIANGIEYKRELIDVSYPLRSDFDITFTVPSDMTATEAKRLSEHIRTIYYKEH